MNYITRPYSQSDDDFVWNLHQETNRPYIERRRIFDEEYERQVHEKRVNASEGFIIEADNKPVGCYFVLDKGDHYEIGRFFLTAEWRNKGLGTKIMRPVLDRYAQPGKPILIHVWEENPVQEFWRKLGFVFQKQNGPFKDMIYSKETT